MLTIVILDAEIELIPKELWNHRQVKAYAKKFNRKPSELLLDASFCHAAMKKLEEWERRGRPDIIHHLLLASFDSPLGIEGKIEAYIHTRENRIFYVPPKTRIPKNYLRFMGLFAKLLQGESGPIIKEVKNIELREPVFILHPKGKMEKPDFWYKMKGSIVVGGFPKGDYRTKIKGKKISVAPHELTAASALSLVLSWIYEGFLRRENIL